MRRLLPFASLAVFLAGLLLPWLSAAEEDAVPGLVATLKGHKEAVYGIAFTPDGQHVVTASGDPSVKVWVGATGKEIKNFAGPNGHKQLVLSVAVGPDGQVFATGGSDNTARLWDFPTSKNLREFALAGEGNAVAVSADGTRVAGAGKDGHVKLWNAADGKLLFDLAGHQGPVHGVAFSPNGQLLVSAGADRTLRFWNPLDGKALAVYGGHAAAARAVGFAPAGNVLYSAGEDGTLKFWALPPVASRPLPPLPEAISSLALSADGAQVLAAAGKEARLLTAATGAAVRTFTGAAGKLETVALAPGNALVAGGTADGQLLVWQAKDGQVLGHNTAHTGAVKAVGFNAGSTQLLTAGGDGLAKLWALPPAPTHTFKHAAAVRAAVNLDGKRIATGGADKVVRIWNVANPKAPERQLSGHTAAVNAVVYSPAGASLISAGDDETIRFWNPTKGEQTALLGAHAGPIHSLALAPSGTQVLSASEDGTLKLWQFPPAAGKNLFAHAGAVSSAVLSADGTRLLTGCADKQVRLWNLASGAVERTFPGHTLGVLAVALSPRGDRVAAGGADKSLWVWDGTGKKLHTLLNLPGAVQAVAFSPDGKYLAAGLADNSVHLIDVTTGKGVQKFTEHTGAVHAVAFSAKGDQVFSAGADKVVRAWGVPDGKARGAFEHDAVVTALALSKDGTRLASGGADKAVKFWTLADGKLAATVATPGEVRGVSFSPDGKQLAVAGADNRARVYDVGGAQREYLAHDGAVNAVAFAADGKRVFTASEDKTARAWSLSLVWQARHTGAVRQAVFSPRGDRVVSAGADKTVRLWNALDGKALRSIAAHDGAVVGVGISADGTRVLSAGADRTAKLWDLGPTAPKEDKPLVTVKLPATPEAVAMSANGLRLAVGVADKKPGTERIHVYDAAGKELLVLGDAAGAPVRSLAFLADNRTLLAGGADQTARLLDVNVLAVFEAHAGGVNGVAFHTDGVRAWTGGADKTVKAWNLTTGKLERTLGPLADAVQALALSRDGLQVGAAGGKALKVWTVNDGKEMLSLDHPEAVHGLSFSADKARLATAAADGRARVWDVASKRELQAFLHTGAARAVAFHPSNNAVLVSGGADKAVAVHTVTATRLVNVGTPVQGLAVAPAGTHVLTAGADGSVKLWNSGTGNADRTCAGAEKAVHAVAVARTGQLIATGGADGKVRLYGYNDAELLSTFTAPAAVRGLAFNPTSQALVAACADGSLRSWDVAFTPGQPLPAEFGKAVQTNSHAAAATDVVFPAAGALFYSSSADKTVRAWKFASEAPTRTFTHPNSVNAVAFNPAGTQLATGCSDGRVRLFDLAKGTQLREIVAHNTPNMQAVYCVAWSPDGKQVVSGSLDQSLKVWDAASGALVRELKAYKEKVFEKGHQEAVLSVAFTPDGKQVVSGGMDKTIKVWNVADGAVARELANPGLKGPAHPGWVYALRFTPDGKHLVSAGAAPRLRGYLAVWDLAGGKLAWGKELAVGTVFALAVSADGKSVALGTGGSVRSGAELNQGVVLKLPGAGK